jgi:S1-C subfamily serine protease
MKWWADNDVTDVMFVSYDGYAAQAGFRSGDIIIGVEVCHAVSSLKESSKVSVADVNIDGEPSEAKVVREMQSITPFTTDEEWTKAATSCELLEPQSPTVLMIRRFEILDS